MGPAFQNVGNSSTPKWEFKGFLSNGTSAGFMLNTDFELVLILRTIFTESMFKSPVLHIWSS
jgi:hypothetical protein